MRAKELFSSLRRGHAREAARRPRGRIHGVLHAGLTVSDFEAAVAWYHDILGFHLITEQVLRGPEADALEGLYGRRGLTVRLGFLRAPDGSVLEIFEFTPADAAAATVWTRVGYTHIALSVSGVSALVERLRAKGVHFVTPAVQFTGGAHWVFFQDPDGNLLELIDLHANRLPLRYLGGIVGRLYKRGKFAAYYG